MLVIQVWRKSPVTKLYEWWDKYFYGDSQLEIALMDAKALNARGVRIVRRTEDVVRVVR